uniref:Virulence plasmid B protein n=1 Tax=Candidatus Kentrum sp. TC TaxID=2126339 RepID=A0A451AED7_9GAMM|nr:MAG: virulence plasmid B protein [Candidatus Kentron sp. TC]
MSIRSIFRYVTALALFAVIFSGAHAEKPVGSIPGRLTVEQSAAVYTIPIEVPPGAAGMQPDLAITYNSNGGNGLLGVGFSLSGLSVITRCGKTIAQDGARGGVYYDSRDRFCLDGQRLIAISGADGGNGAEYRTEIDGYSRIISYGQQGSGSAWWKVWTKAGQAVEYGKTADSRIEAQGKSTVRLWAVNRIADTVGNGIDFEYYENHGTGEYYPTRIEYAGGKVKFGYTSRNNPIQETWVAGSKLRKSVHINNISTYIGESLVSTLVPEYTRRDTSLLLTDLEWCDSEGKCIPKVGFIRDSYELPGNFDVTNNYASSKKSVGCFRDGKICKRMI